MKIKLIYYCSDGLTVAGIIGVANLKIMSIHIGNTKDKT